MKIGALPAALAGAAVATGVIVLVVAATLPALQPGQKERSPLNEARDSKSTAMPPAGKDTKRAASAPELGSVNYAGAAPGAHNVALLSSSDDLLPVEWEDAFFDIFEDSNQPMSARNQRLIELVTRTAAGVPSVQRAGLLHLAYGLADDDVDSFLAVLQSTSVPSELRLQMLSTVFDFRPQSLVQQLAEELSKSDEAPVAQASREMLNELAALQEQQP